MQIRLSSLNYCAHFLKDKQNSNLNANNRIVEIFNKQKWRKRLKCMQHSVTKKIFYFVNMYKCWFIKNNPCFVFLQFIWHFITCGESINNGPVISASSSLSGNTGLSFKTVVNILTVETVTNRRNAVSTSEHLLTGWQLSILVPRGKSIAARAQSTKAWWNSNPWDHLGSKLCFQL